MTDIAQLAELRAVQGDPTRRWNTPTRAADVGGQVRKRRAPSEALKRLDLLR
jgi:hypothetical protein